MEAIPRGSAICFTGHRHIPAADIPRLTAQLASVIDTQASQGTTHFICGGALGFDTLAAQCVLAARKVNPLVRLVLALPCHNQQARWNAAERAVYADILSQADEVVYTADSYSPDCMNRRNRFMVDNASAVVTYCIHAYGGTANTIAYAARENVTRIRLGE